MSQKQQTDIVIVAAMGKDTRAIGKENGLLWHVPDDMRRFKEKSMGHPLILGRKTFESILKIVGKPLPGRTSIVVTRNKDYHFDGVLVASNFEEALKKARELDPKEIHIGGGEEIYRQALPYVTKLFLTFFHDDVEGDAQFPPFENEFNEVARHGIREHNRVLYEWVDFERKNTQSMPKNS